MIQAKSLSSVVTLADDPPATIYSDQETLDPLVLYIARVPGYRDVFLTTTKPLQKVVTAQDVQSSLYYIHLDSQDDERLRESIGSSQPDANQKLTAQPQLPTNPRVESVFNGLLSTNPPGAKSRLESPLPALDKFQAFLSDPSPPTTIVRKPVGQGSPPNSPAAQARLKPSGPHTIGPRAMHSRLHSVDSPGLRLAHGKENLMPRRWSEQPTIALSSAPFKKEAPEPSVAASARDTIASCADKATSLMPDQPGNAARYHDERRQFFGLREEDLSLTLIRRYDGSQWNVGKVFSACQPGEHSKNFAQSQPDEIGIQISTSGYSKYCPPSPNASIASPQIFERRLFSRHHRRSEDKTVVENSPSTMNRRTPRMSMDFRRLSKPHGNGPQDVNERMKRSPEGTSTGIKGYAFYSPWNGTCEFSSGVTDQTLKCKHTAPEQGSQAVPVSELRFNLPTSNGRGAASPNVLRSPDRPRNSKRSSYFSNKRGSESTYAEASEHIPTNDEDEDQQLDLSLGQERAGGGFGGKQAKLGKLIVEPEGLKMLDLVVAANMALWWKVYERSA
ncbi:MAG: hypothetical protein Q9226_001790 [Calogaya cf. arnoldii]